MAFFLTKCRVAAACALIIGLILGTFLGARFKPNHIVFRVENSKKVFLVPKKGDIIDWEAETPDTQKVTIGFLGTPPCKGASNKGRCVFEPYPHDNSPNSGIDYNYVCADDNSNAACEDPGWGGGGSKTAGPGIILQILRLFEQIFVFFVTKFADFGDDPLTNFTDTSFYHEHNSTEPLNEGAIVSEKATVVVDTLTPYITCDPHNNNNAVMYPDPSTTAADKTLTAGVGSTIYWKAGITFSFTLDSGICDSGSGKTINNATNSCKVIAGTGPSPWPPQNKMITTSCSGNKTTPLTLVIHP